MNLFFLFFYKCARIQEARFIDFVLLWVHQELDQELFVAIFYLITKQ